MGPIKASEKKKHATVVTATDHKEQGNKCFAQRRYAEALACYTKAIVRKTYCALLCARCAVVGLLGC